MNTARQTPRDPGGPASDCWVRIKTVVWILESGSRGFEESSMTPRSRRALLAAAIAGFMVVAAVVLATAGRGDGLSVLEEKGGGMKKEEDSALHHLSSSNLVQKAAADCAQDPQCVPVGGICPARMCRYVKRERERERELCHQHL